MPNNKVTHQPSTTTISSTPNGIVNGTPGYGIITNGTGLTSTMPFTNTTISPQSTTAINPQPTTWIPNNDNAWQQWPISKLIKVENTSTHCPHCLKKNSVCVSIEKTDSNLVWSGCPRCFHTLLINVGNNVLIHERYLKLKSSVFKLLTYAIKIIRFAVKRDGMLKMLVNDVKEQVDLTTDD